MTEHESHWPELVATGATGGVENMAFPTAAELPPLVQLAQGQRLLIAGHGSKLSWGQPVQNPQLLVSTQNLDQLIDHAIGDLTVTVEAGISFRQLQAQLATANQFLPLDPLFPDRATIGGIIATADTGSLRQRYGGVRDLLLGIHWVRPDGQVAKAGGRVVKNVAGYDLMKLFTGSYGTLGILQQVTLRVYPIPPAQGGVWVAGQLGILQDLAAKLGQMTLTPTALDAVSASLAHKLDLGHQAGILVRFQTIPASIQAQSDRLIALAQSLGAEILRLDEERTQTIWRTLRSACLHPILVKVGMRTTSALEILAAVDGPGLVHLGSGIGLVGLPSPERIVPLRRHCEAAGGYLSVLMAPHPLKETLDVWGQRFSSGDAPRTATKQLDRQLRQQFDPSAMFNPGKFFSP